jgi:CheY-like chemotaxis protein
LAADRQLGSIPVVILGDGTDEQTLRRCRKHDAYYVPKGPDTGERLRPIVCRLSKIEDRAARAIEPSASDPTTNAAESEEAGLPKVLLIEDDPDYSRALQIKLRAYGIEVLRAFNGTHGVQMAWEKTPDLIITDYTMPEGYGNYVLRRLKDDRSTMDIPVIVLTGRRIMGQADHALERDLANLGAVRYFTKPVAFEELLAEIRKHIEIPSEPCQTVA